MANLKLTSLLLRLQRPVLDTASYGSGKKSANLLAGNSKNVVGGVGNIGTDQKGQLWNPSIFFSERNSTCNNCNNHHFCHQVLLETQGLGS